MRKIKRHLGKNIGKGTAKIAGLALASVIAAGSAFGVTGVSAMAADDAGITNTQGDGAEEPGEEPTGEIQPGTEEPDEEPTGEIQPGTEEPDEEPTGEIQPGAEEPGEEPAGEIQPGAEEPGEGPAGENQPGTEEPIEIQPDIVEEPVLNLVQTEGGTITAEPIKSSPVDYYEKSCWISAEADPGWYFKEWNLNYITDKGMVESNIDDFNWWRTGKILFKPSLNYIEDTGELIITYGTANVSAVFEKLKEGEYAIYDQSAFTEQKIIFAKAGEKVVYQPNERLDVSRGEDFYVTTVGDAAESVKYEYDENSNTISFIMPENNVDISKGMVKNSAGVSNTKGEESEDGKNETIVVEEDDSGSKTTLPGSETKNTIVSTTAAPVKAGAPAAVYSAPVRNAGLSTTAAQTGDKANTPIWIAAAAGSVAAALGALVIRRKKNSEE